MADEPATALSASRRASIAGRIGPEYPWAVLSHHVPGGWGGYFLKVGVPTHYLVDPGQREAAFAALRAQGYGYMTEGATVTRGRWTFAELYEWHTFLEVRLPDLTLSGIDTSENRLAYGVPDGVALGRTEERLRSLDVPCSLVTLGVVGGMVDD